MVRWPKHTPWPWVLCPGLSNSHICRFMITNKLLLYVIMSFQNWGKGYRHEVLTAVVMKSTIFWDITVCSPLSVNRRFGVIYRLHLHGGFLLSLFLRPWRWRRYVTPKRRLTLNGLHGVISRKMVLFMRFSSSILDLSKSMRDKILMISVKRRKLKNPMTSSGIKPATFRLVA
jgi:hypothetical protein